LSDEAATPTGGAETSARPDVSAEKPASVQDRLKASLFGTPEPEAKPQVARAEAVPVEPEPEQEEEPVKPQDEPEEDAPTEEPEADPETLEELAERLGWDLDKVLNLKTKTKIDGKEDSKLLRDLVKSHQLEGHLNQKLMAFADEKKAFETERQTHIQQQHHKMLQMDAALQVATRMLQGEFADVNWQQLQNENPLEFNQRYVAFQQRQVQLNHMADLLGHERKTAEAQTAQQQQAYLSEQKTLMETKMPEWNDSAKRDKDIAEWVPVLKDAYGITEQELRSREDHREILVLRDAIKWQQLQKAKPAIVNKVKTAPKLLKPGAPQSRAAQEGLLLKQERDRLRKSGKVIDAKAPLKRLLFS
jgi:hypothetical protein